MESLSDYDVENTLNNMVEIVLVKDDDFLKIKETLTRIGVPSYKEKKLYQTCHILHKRGRYYIVHFKEMFSLDGKVTTFDEGDLLRRNAIVRLLQQWNLCKVVDEDSVKVHEELSRIKIIKFQDKDKWHLVPKYSIGTPKQNF